MKKIIFVFLCILSIINHTNAKDFFLNITDQIAENEFRLSYGVSVTDAVSYTHLRAHETN